jgi:Alpha amylase, catalytic domain
MSDLRATYRLQLRPHLDFAAARKLVPYLIRLGISHLYLSPAMQARSGSTHGYDVVDPTHVADDLGGEEELRRLCEAGLGVILDIVPNHMAASRDENPFWRDPLWRAKFFDVEGARVGERGRAVELEAVVGPRLELEPSREDAVPLRLEAPACCADRLGVWSPDPKLDHARLDRDGPESRMAAHGEVLPGCPNGNRACRPAVYDRPMRKRTRELRKLARTREELAELEDRANVCVHREPRARGWTPLDRSLDYHMMAGNRAASRAFADAGSVRALRRSPEAAGTLSTDEGGGKDDLMPAGPGIVVGEAEVADQTPGVTAPDADAAIAADQVGGPAAAAAPDAASAQAASPSPDASAVAKTPDSSTAPTDATQSPDPTGGTPAPAAAAPPVINSRTDMHAPDGTPDSRQVIAMGEVVYFDVGGEAVSWTASAGWPGRRSARSTFAWELPQPGTATITATTAAGASASITMTAVPPKDIRMRKTSEDAPGDPGTANAGMRLAPRFTPGNVNFGNVEWLEVPGGPSNLTGYFAAQVAAGVDLNHHPNPDFLRIAPGLNDHAAAFGFPGPYSAGTWDWEIPNRFRRAATTGEGEMYVTTVQSFSIDSSGAITVSKQGASVTTAAVPD